jgi:hypothetical protein
MSNLQRRLKKLETLLTDDAGLVPGSRRWLDYWLDQFDRIVRGEKARGVPLAIFDAIVAAAESEQQGVG